MSKVVIVGIALILGAAVGRYSLPAKIETKIVEVEKKQTETEREKHKETVTTVKEKPDGTKETTTTVKEDTNTTKSTKEDRTANTESTKTYGGAKTAVYALAGLSGTTPVYGALVSRSLLGPIRGGVWGLTSMEFGVSLGLEF